VGNGKINYSEFIAATLSQRIYMNEERLWIAFKYFDIDNSGFITADNLMEAMKKVGKVMSEQEVAEMIQEADLKDN